jgi:hypothetical protein
MADENETLDPQPRRRAPPPTIDLEATSVSGPGEAAASSDPPPSSEPPPSSDPPPSAEESGRSDPTNGTPARSHVAHVVAGAIGAALALIVAATAWLTLAPPPDRSASDDATARLARIEAQLDALPKTPPPAPPSVDPKALDDLTRRLAQIESALANPATPLSDAAVAARLAAVESAINDLKPLAGAEADLTRRLDETAGAARAARERADAAATAAANVPRPPAPVDTTRFATRDDVDALAARLGTVEAAVKSLGDRFAKTASINATGGARDAIAALALRLAVERGAPYTNELAAIDSTVADKATRDALAPFAQSGVPDAATLARELAALLPAVRKAAEPPPASQDNGLIGRLQADAARLVRIRPVTAQAGDDPAAILTRLDAAAAQRDIAAARAEADKLPPAVRAPLEPWVKRVAQRDAALSAAAALVSRSFAALRAPAAPAVPTAPQGASER